MNQILKETDKIRVPINQLEDIRQSHGGYDFYHYQGKPFNGYLVMDYFENGNVMFEEEYRDGEHQGWDNEYYETGELKESSLMLGATTLKYWEYNKDGSVAKEGKQMSKEKYNQLVTQYNLLD